ncbi:GDSL-type esterase/lipase family protein [Desulfofustis glycolicus]|uniref:GDSL-like Lipase/Acylhydrolase family protein n=1 Tax=Desulfofustis glycolicus DSM 9705 TaxID=1121409 RepID=A0A1M5YNY7_9BACT|nr:GDSL-type esterase/lipase family protein [Desulfofustis glycolicus]SHI13589.1 GDSL-like Lipase/Acylhydrolase family protein [Desulfofustis glycolicus DSM 9705]
MFKPDQDVYRFGNRILINHYGMRTNPFTEISANEFRIMVFGDSVLNGGNLTDHDSLATTILQKKLTKETGKQVVVGNVSAGSWGPGNWLSYAKEYGFFDADVVILLISSHDFADNPTFQPLDKSTHPTSRPTLAVIEGITRYLPRYFQQFKQSDNSNDIGPLLGNDFQNRSDIGLENLKEFLLLAQDKSQFVLVFQYWEKEEVERGEAKHGNKRIKEVCESLELYSVQLKPYFQHSLENGTNPYRDDIHPNLVGQKLLASAFLENLPDDIFRLPRK